MLVKTVELRCPNCGAPVSLNTKECEYCASPIVIQIDSATPSDNNNIESSGTCVPQHDLSVIERLLKAKLYDKALANCEVITDSDFDNADAYFLAAIASLQGKRPFLISSSTIKKAENLLQAAISINPKGIYYYLWSYIRLDHYFKKFYKASPNYKELYSMAVNAGLLQTEVDELYSILDVERPSEL